MRFFGYKLALTSASYVDFQFTIDSLNSLLSGYSVPIRQIFRLFPLFVQLIPGCLVNFRRKWRKKL